jgi:hypothetical protein
MNPQMIDEHFSCYSEEEKEIEKRVEWTLALQHLVEHIPDGILNQVVTFGDVKIEIQRLT